MEAKRTDVNSLGEFGLIDHLTRHLRVHKRVLKKVLVMMLQ